MAKTVMHDLDGGVPDDAELSKDKVTLSDGLTPLHSEDDDLKIEVDWNAPNDDDPPQQALEDDDKKAEEDLKEEEEHVDDDLNGYSEKVRKRIMRERRVTLREREEKEAAIAEAIRLRQQLEEVSAKTHAQDVDKEIASAKERLRQARADQDFDLESEMVDKIAELHVKRANPPKPKETPVVPREETNDAKEDWLSRNAWYEDPRYETQSDAAVRISERLVRQGKNPKNKSFWVALDQELERSVVLPKREKPKSPTPTVRAETPVKRGNSIVITAQDRATARKFGLDLDDPVQLKAYAQEKARTA